MNKKIIIKKVEKEVEKEVKKEVEKELKKELKKELNRGIKKECSNISIDLQGGIGNQLFQIAFIYGLSNDLNINYKIVKNKFLGCGQGSHPSKYYDNIFEKVNFVESLKIDFTLREKQYTFYPIIDDIKKFTSSYENIKLEGAFQSEFYFKKYSKQIKELFTPSIGIIKYLEINSNIFNQFPELKKEHDFAYIGVRRGDYIKDAHIHNPCGMIYYNKAISLLNKDRYYIATDDIEWVKKNFIGDKFRFFEIKNDLHQLLCSTLFKNYIISNSSFHWWGSFLSIYKYPRILVPDKWVFGKDVQRDKYWSIYRDEMEILERTIEIN